MNISTAGVAEKAGRYFVALREPGSSIGEVWEFPGGKVEEGENTKEALVREYLEEFNVDIEVGSEICTGTFQNNEIVYILYAYSIKLLAEEFQLTEHQCVSWFTLEELKGLEFAESDRTILNFLLNKNRL